MTKLETLQKAVEVAERIRKNAKEADEIELAEEELDEAKKALADFEANPEPAGPTEAEKKAEEKEAALKAAVEIAEKAKELDLPTTGLTFEKWAEKFGELSNMSYGKLELKLAFESMRKVEKKEKLKTYHAKKKEKTTTKEVSDADYDKVINILEEDLMGAIQLGEDAVLKLYKEWDSSGANSSALILLFKAYVYGDEKQIELAKLLLREKMRSHDQGKVELSQEHKDMLAALDEALTSKMKDEEAESEPEIVVVKGIEYNIANCEEAIAVIHARKEQRKESNTKSAHRKPTTKAVGSIESTVTQIGDAIPQSKIDKDPSEVIKVLKGFSKKMESAFDELKSILSETDVERLKGAVAVIEEVIKGIKDEGKYESGGSVEGGIIERGYTSKHEVDKEIFDAIKRGNKAIVELYHKWGKTAKDNLLDRAKQVILLWQIADEISPDYFAEDLIELDAKITASYIMVVEFAESNDTMRMANQQWTLEEAFVELLAILKRNKKGKEFLGTLGNVFESGGSVEGDTKHTFVVKIQNTDYHQRRGDVTYEWNTESIIAGMNRSLGTNFKEDNPSLEDANLVAEALAKYCEGRMPNDPSPEGGFVFVEVLEYNDGELIAWPTEITISKY